MRFKTSGLSIDMIYKPLWRCTRVLCNILGIIDKEDNDGVYSEKRLDTIQGSRSYPLMQEPFRKRGNCFVKEAQKWCNDLHIWFDKVYLTSSRAWTWYSQTYLAIHLMTNIFSGNRPRRLPSGWIRLNFLILPWTTFKCLFKWLAFLKPRMSN